MSADHANPFAMFSPPVLGLAPADPQPEAPKEIPMSILTDLFEKKITFSQAASEAGAWASKVVSADPILTNAASAVLSDVKQGASNAVVAADTMIGAAVLPAAKGVEVALDAALATLTKGASVPFNPFVNDGIDQMAAAIKAEADAWALKAKAALAPAVQAS